MITQEDIRGSGATNIPDPLRMVPDVKRGHRVVVVENGKEVLAALEKETFDLILMDVQMPEMDGFEATTPFEDKNQQTIVALTAHALKGDNEKRLAAGMDG